ncbi:ferredoxin [Actinospica durhamensis]|uniref:Ferredoxin n=1 Tax=Actinospica durhamensis TaxID=1508375 RepID=A0A941ETL7_9ACTN|nr:ferredoxin [Actinospica durhamensis]MBR7837842.1 ferredoxin [Actinospica durhamensis]
MKRTARRLVIDRIACTGHGLCAELFPEQLALDDWGYPIQSPGPIAGGDTRHAQRAVAACPALAMRLEAARG